MGFGFYWEYTGSKYLTRNYCSLHESSATVCRPLDQYIKHSFTNVLVVYLSRSGIVISPMISPPSRVQENHFYVIFVYAWINCCRAILF